MTEQKEGIDSNDSFLRRLLRRGPIHAASDIWHAGRSTLRSMADGPQTLRKVAGYLKSGGVVPGTVTMGHVLEQLIAIAAEDEDREGDRREFEVPEPLPPPSSPTETETRHRPGFSALLDEGLDEPPAGMCWP